GIQDGSSNNPFRYSIDGQSCASQYSSPKNGCGFGWWQTFCDCTFNEYAALDLSGGGKIAGGVIDELSSGAQPSYGSKTGRVAPPAGIGGRLLGNTMRVALATGEREGKAMNAPLYLFARQLESVALQAQFVERYADRIAAARLADFQNRGLVLG